jgi:Ca2+-dependent lipid-binding protein
LREIIIMRQGRLYVGCLKAELTKDHDLTGKMDPFVRVTVGKVSKQTKSHEEGGLKPVWNQELEFEVNGTEEFMEVEVLDDDGGGKFDFIGKDSFDFGTLVSNPLKDL